MISILDIAEYLIEDNYSNYIFKEFLLIEFIKLSSMTNNVLNIDSDNTIENGG